MTMTRMLYIVSVLIVCTLLIPFAHADKTVTSTGFGSTVEQAKKDALRSAVEQGCGVKIFSETVVKDFVALKDVMVSESFGMVTSYKVISENKKDDGVEVTIEATVSDKIDSQWAKIKVLLEQKRNPTVMFCLRQTLDNVEMADSTAEYALNKKFRELGFKVIDREFDEKTRDLQKNVQAMDKNLQNVIALSSKQGANLIVIGTMEGTFAKMNENYGLPEILHNYNFRTKIIRTDTSQIVSSVVKDYTTKMDGSIHSRESAGKTGFAQVAEEKFIELIIMDLIKTWIQDNQQGTDMTLIVSNVKFSQRKRVLQALQKHPDLIQSIQVKHFRNNRLELALKSKLNPEELVEKIEEAQDLPLTLVEFNENRIEFSFDPNKK